ncbi:MAG: 3-dehydro-4-phosphotetronate decarboxylase [Subtercola sp.]|nr:3-dehydro-4-phosphotetronate decarboxylase [Subtercola sp.]
MTIEAELVDAGRQLAALGLSPGASGNISVRRGSEILMTPTGTSLGALDGIELAVLDPVDGHRSGGRPSKEFPLHRAFYAKDPGLTAVVHLHSPYAMAASCLAPWSERSAIPPLSPYFVMRVGQTPLIPYAPPGDPALGDLLEAVPFAFTAALLRNHGQIVAAGTLALAVDAAIELEEACRLMVLVGHRDPALLTEEQSRELAVRSGTHWG